MKRVGRLTGETGERRKRPRTLHAHCLTRAWAHIITIHARKTAHPSVYSSLRLVSTCTHTPVHVFLPARCGATLAVAPCESFGVQGSSNGVFDQPPIYNDSHRAGSKSVWIYEHQVVNETAQIGFPGNQKFIHYESLMYLDGPLFWLHFDLGSLALRLNALE